MNARYCMIVSLAVVCAAFAVCQAAQATVVVGSPSLPVTYPDGVYRTPQDVHAEFGGPALLIVLSSIEHRAFAIPPIVRTPVGPDEREQFSSEALGNVTVFINGIQQGPAQPFQATGPVTTLVHGLTGQTTGSFDTEMLSMDLSGNSPFGPMMIRESPTLASLGHTTVTDLGGGGGGGPYQIDSFFDIFTELSIDGGQTWIHSNGPARVDLVPLPEPIGLALLGIAGLALRRRK